MKLKILTYNVNKSRSWNFLEDTSLKIRDLIKESDADIVFLQEVIGENLERGVNKPHFEDLADEVWTDYAYAKNAVYPKGHHGNAILSKYPIVKWDQQDLSTNRFEQRGLLFASIEVGANKTPLHLYCVHLDLLFRGREIQINKIIQRIKNESKNIKYIIAGDFNDWNYQTGKILESSLAIEDAAKKLLGKYLVTFPSFYPALSLDRIYLNHLSPVKVSTILQAPFFGFSDHLPILCEVEIED